MLDLSRSAITVSLGIWDIDPAAFFEAGAPVNIGASGVGVAADGAGFSGVAKWNKTASLVGVIVDEQIILTATDAIPLEHANLESAALVKVTNLAGTTVYALTTDYTVNTTNGTVTRVALGAITAGQSVKVTYRYSLTQAEKDVIGANYMNSQDDTVGSNKMTVIQNYALVYTSVYDTSKVYAIDTSLTVDAGKFRPSTGVEVVVAKVRKVPAPSDVYLGIQLV